MIRANERESRVSDDRFSDPAVFKKPDPQKIPDEITDGTTPEEYFRKAFSRGQQKHPVILRTAQWYPQTYEKVRQEFEGKK